MRLRSLRWQLQLWHAALLATLIAAVLVAFYGYEKRARIARIDAELSGPLVSLLPRHIRPPGRETPNTYDPANNNAVERNLEASGHYIIVFGREGRTLYASDSAPDTVPDVNREAERGVMRGRWNGGNRELVNVSPRGEIVILGRFAASLEAELRTFALKLAALGLGVVAAGLIGGHFIARRTARQLGSIGEAARRVAAGGWHERIPLAPAPEEIADLRAVLNDSFDRIAAAYEQQRRFTADASHELGTPVSVILAKTQHALSRPRAPEDYMDALRVCRRAGERMQALNRALLDLADCDASAAPRRIVECDLAEVSREALALVAPRAEEHRARIDTNLAPVTARVDPLGVGQVLVNLLNNALAHNTPGVRILLSLHREADHAILSVADDGAGVPAESLPHLFDRFYRADSARTHDQRGAGLGLSIVHEIVRLHGGSVGVDNRPEGGAIFTVRLPLATDARA